MQKIIKNSPKKKSPESFELTLFVYARVILPERRQREHTLTVVCSPLTTALTFLMFGFHALLVLRLEWDTLQPNVTPLPQMQHFAILSYTSINGIHLTKVNMVYYITVFYKMQ